MYPCTSNCGRFLLAVHQRSEEISLTAISKPDILYTETTYCTKKAGFRSALSLRAKQRDEATDPNQSNLTQKRLKRNSCVTVDVLYQSFFRLNTRRALTMFTAAGKKFYMFKTIRQKYNNFSGKK